MTCIPLLSWTCLALVVLGPHAPSDRRKVNGALGAAERLRRESKLAEADALLRKAEPEAGEYRYLVLTALGDVSRETSKVDWRTPLEHYSSALRASPKADDAAAARMIDLCRNRSVPEPEIAKVCQLVQTAGHARLASEGWRLVLERVQPGGDGYAEALIAYVEAECDRTAFGQRSLEALRRDESPAAAELRALAESPKAELIWWLAQPLHRHIVCAALANLAQGWLAQERADTAVEALERAFEVGPEYGAYAPGSTLSGKRVATLDAALRLASLLHSHPEIERAEERFRYLEGRLIDGKNLSYLEQNLPAMRAFHTVLGTLYAEREQWSDSMHGATYHLRRAAQIADLQTQQDASARPAPELKALLAHGLAQQDPKEAGELWTSAAVDFITLGDLGEARATFVRAHELGKLPDRATGIEQLLDFRIQVEELERFPERDGELQDLLPRVLQWEKDWGSSSPFMNAQLKLLRERLDPRRARNR